MITDWFVFSKNAQCVSVELLFPVQYFGMIMCTCVRCRECVAQVKQDVIERDNAAQDQG